MTLLLYFWAILQDGDERNDWLTHLPRLWRGTVLVLGTLLDMVVGR